MVFIMDNLENAVSMEEKVIALLKKELRLKDKPVTPASRIKDDLGADSLDVLQLLMTLEEEFGYTIPDERLAKFVTVQDIIEYMESMEAK